MWMEWLVSIDLGVLGTANAVLLPRHQPMYLENRSLQFEQHLLRFFY